MGGNSTDTMSLKLKIWRQKNAKDKGGMVDYNLDGISPDMSFLEMLDILNNKLVTEKGDQIAFDHDCREGICGMCSLMINGQAHGPQANTTTCQLHMRKFKNGDEIVIEPWRAKAFPVIKDLMVDRTAMDQIMAAGGYVNVNTGNAPDGNSILIGQNEAELAMDAAACIGCGACVASCKNASAMLFVSAKVSQLALLPQGQIEAETRALAMVEKMDELGFGNCTNEAECEAQCPKGIKLDNIARMNRGVVRGLFAARK
ncbi:succinate dehydrogenase/fumarate reductase iron-sulfur subunit [Bacteriovorax sp. PP10]|uniref:Succinate dehydrogenase/fumarate reductase iron-sulfur subunit n=2 Tax=Bacteriovorax antarcticus TaxID=3088717 RepID=A0ABU5VZG4_9BACT|nr:succinate dehydrogenase/fumarate reductase iron-sulfur subunit [Bacteriovorax sp. PP10]MEA9357977.1 succinate dehydrogenase/fumarate reductase iron-sulfur subunit [Bacteriovorax sp. PP10]